MARSDLCFIPFSTLFHVSCFIPVSFLQDRSFPLFPAILPPHPPSFAQMDKLQTLIESGNIPEILSYCEATELAVILILLHYYPFSIYLSIYLLDCRRQEYSCSFHSLQISSMLCLDHPPPHDSGKTVMEGGCCPGAFPLQDER